MSKFVEKTFLLAKINWEKVNGLLPVIIQDNITKQVLMLGFMNQEALIKTLNTGLVTFWSRTKARLWVKGETSENYLVMQNINLDCDQDTLLIQALPQGPTCHLGNISCFNTPAPQINFAFLQELEQLIASRKKTDASASYTASLFAKGTKRIAQKVGEEGVEVALAAMHGDKSEILSESADLLYHLLVLLQDQDCTLAQVIDELAKRRN